MNRLAHATLSAIRLVLVLMMILSMLICLPFLTPVMYQAEAETSIVSKFQDVSVSDNNMGMVDSSGRLFTYGKNGYGALGQGTTGDSNAAVMVLTDVKSVTCGSFNIAAIKKDGSLWISGMNFLWDDIENHIDADDFVIGQYGIASIINPVKAAEHVKSVALTDAAMAYIDENDALWVWGSELLSASDATGKVKVMENVQSVSLGAYGGSIAALKKDGTLWTWGSNSKGDLGISGEGDQTTPVQVLDNVKEVSLGYGLSGAIKTDGSLWTWGSDDTTGVLPSKRMDGVKSISFRRGSAGVIKEDDSLWVWGDNVYGGLGDGTMDDRTDPICVLENVKKVCMGLASAAIDNDNKLWFWGNIYFQSYWGNGAADRVLEPKGVSVQVDSEPESYTVTYDANGGSYDYLSEDKMEDVPLVLSEETPIKNYLLSYDANGGNVSPSFEILDCIFNGWNTEKNGTGTTYAPGDSYTNNADVTLYAQWTDPKAGIQPTPTRDGYVFEGWFTSSTGGSKIDALSTITESMTLYAHWMNDSYNMKDETYSFGNYVDDHAPSGHCFGMSMTSSGFYNKWLDIAIIGGNANTSLYSFRDTETVRAPICHYQLIQGSFRERATVAGGSWYLKGEYNIASDWQQVINYVKNHNYDNKGLLQVAIRANGGGHAINFLRYENVDGQDRIYAYDNNIPDREVYLYYSNGEVIETPEQSLSGRIECIAIRDVKTYLKIAEKFEPSRAVYMEEGVATVKGYRYSYMEGNLNGVEYVMYEIPENRGSVIIVPHKDNASFVYMNKEYRFGKVTDETYGVLNLAPANADANSSGESFIAYNEKDVKKGKVYIRDGQEYVVTALPANGGQGEVALKAAKNAKNVAIPASVKLTDGKTYKVTAVNAMAFKGKGNIRNVTIGKNVKKLNKNAFSGSKATRIVLKTKKLTKKASVKGSLKGSKITTIQVKVAGKKSVNKKYVKKYKKVFTKKNAGRKTRIK